MAYERGDQMVGCRLSTVEQLLREAHGTELENTVTELFGELIARQGICNLPFP